MKYKCGVFMYDLPKSCCVFCQNAEVLWDFTNGIYAIFCPKNKKIDNKTFLKGCYKRIPYPEGTDFSK